MAVEKHHGSWRVKIYVKGKLIHMQGGFAEKLDAQIYERDVKENLKINTDFLKLCESRLEDLELKRSKKHFKENRALIRQWIERWGAKRITRDDVEEYLREIARQSKPRANKYLRLLRALFNHGIERGWLKQNPCQGIKRYPESKQKRYIPPEEDIVKVLALAKPRDRLYLLAVAHTLGRVRAVNHLKWEDVSDNEIVLYTRKAKNSDLKEIRVPINEVLRSVLSDLPREGEYVFTNPLTGKPYDYRDKFLPNLCKKAGVRKFMYHALRHFGASKLDNCGVALTDIQQLLGHERPTTTDLYLQSLRGSVKEAVRKLEGLK
ncbi:MAG: tyrosine-type recombinase/integrase [Syntrophobacteraceae bacterium]